MVRQVFYRCHPIDNSGLRTDNAPGSAIMTGPGEAKSSESKDEEMRARIQVIVRVRPPLPAEVKSGRFTSCLGLGPSTDAGQTLFMTGSGALEKVTRYTFHKHLSAGEVSVAALQLLSASWKVFPEGELDQEK